LMQYCYRYVLSLIYTRDSAAVIQIHQDLSLFEIKFVCLIFVCLFCFVLFRVFGHMTKFKSSSRPPEKDYKQTVNVRHLSSMFLWSPPFQLFINYSQRK